MSTTEPDTPEPDDDDDGQTVVVIGDNATINVVDADEPDADTSGG